MRRNRRKKILFIYNFVFGDEMNGVRKPGAGKEIYSYMRFVGIVNKCLIEKQYILFSILRSIMGDTQYVQGLSTNLKKAVCWISETVQNSPDKKRDAVIKEAELRFDLTPRECEFLNNNFTEISSKCSR